MPPSHPRDWPSCHETPTYVQLTWIAVLGDDTGVPQEVVSREVAGLTLGQAALVIKVLKEHKARLGAVKGGAVLFERAVEYARAELPLPKEEPTPETIATEQEAVVKLEDATTISRLKPGPAVIFVKSET